MKTFRYIDKVYLLGLVLYHITIAWGIIALNDVLLSPWGILYLAMYLLLLRDYLLKYLHYKKQSISVGYEGVMFKCGKDQTFYPREEIKAIIYARHMVRFKIHQVIHLFMKNGESRIVLYDLQDFNGFKAYLKEEYRPFYTEKETLIKGQIDEYQALLQYEYNLKREEALGRTYASDTTKKREYRETLARSSES